MASPTCDGHVEYLLRLADTALVLSQRLGEWSGRGPTLEEDVALTNIALDLLGQATLLLEHAAQLQGDGRSADDLAFLRDVGGFRNALLAEQPNGDFAQTIVRQLLYSAFAFEQWDALRASSDEQLAGIAGKAVKETAYHLRHSAEWLLRLGDGTDESRERAQRALDLLWPFSGELLLVDDVDQQVADAAIAPLASTHETAWRERVEGLIEEAGLQVPSVAWMHRGGKQGTHTEALGHLLAELQFLQRAYPGVTW